MQNKINPDLQTMACQSNQHEECKNLENCGCACHLPRCWYCDFRATYQLIISKDETKNPLLCDNHYLAEQNWDMQMFPELDIPNNYRRLI